MTNFSELPESPWKNYSQYPADIDISIVPYPCTMWNIRPTWEVIIKVSTIIPIVLIGIISNASLIHAIINNKHLRSNTTNLLILNMAVADFCTILFYPGMFIIKDIFQNYQLGDIGCRFDGFLVQALTLVAVFSLSAVSYDRVTAIVLNSSSKLSIRTTQYLMIFSWIGGLIVAVPLAFYRWVLARVWKDATEKFCVETPMSWPYWHVFVGMSVWMPLAVMAICYTTILIKLNHYEKEALKNKQPSTARKHKGRIAKILSLVVLAFIISRVPFTVLVIYRARKSVNNDYDFGKSSYYVMYGLWYLSRYLVFLNAAMNPVLYGWTGGSLKEELESYPPFSWLIVKKSIMKTSKK